MKVNRRKILKYITSRHNLILCRFLVKSFFSFYYFWFSLFILILSSLFSVHASFRALSFVQCRFSVYRTNFGTTEWKFQRLCRSRCNPTRASHPITFVLFDAWSGRFIRTISTRNAASTCTGQSWNYISISSKRWNIASHRLVFSMHTQMKWIHWFDNIEHPLTSFFCLSNKLFLPLCVSQTDRLNVEWIRLSHFILLFLLFLPPWFWSSHFSVHFIQTYADEGYELTNVLEHVYKSMEHYLKDCLSLDPDNKNSGGGRLIWDHSLSFNAAFMRNTIST